MKTNLCTLALCCFSLRADNVADLSFFTGCWEMQAGKVTIEEQWNKPAGDSMLGMGRTIRDGKTVFTEFLRISIANGRLVYTARIGTKGVTDFPLLKMAAGEVTFENPKHDFPQRVIYRKVAQGLFARIEGVDKGKERHEDFSYRKVPCE